MRIFDIRELGKDEKFDPSIIYQETPFTQADFYGQWQEKLGRKVKRFVVSHNGGAFSYFQIIKYPLLFGKSYLYIPYGPVVKDLSEDFLLFLRKELKVIAKRERCVFIRLDFTPSVRGDGLSKFFTKAPLYTYHSAYFQPRAEWFLALNKSESELMSGMHKNTRYSIHVSEKKALQSEIVTDNFQKYFEDFYRLMTETAKRNDFSLHSKEYYKNIFDNLTKENGYLSIARYGEKILAINLVVVFGKVASHIFGGASNEDRDRMPSYSAQWRSILYAKELGCESYNFGGISTPEKAYKGWEGLTAFKKKFGGYEVLHSDFFDIVVSPFIYHIYNLRKWLKSIL